MLIRLIPALGAVCLCLLMTAANTAAAGSEQDSDDQGTEVRVSMDQLPEAVRAVYEKFAAAGEVDDIYLEVENGQTAYSAEVEIGGSEFELKLATDGRILEVEYEEGGSQGGDDDESDSDGDEEDCD